jgi:selenocysteine lyase/cysteine desulfurase
MTRWGEIKCPRCEELEAALPEQIEWVKRLADDLIAAEAREARLEAKLAQALRALERIEVSTDTREQGAIAMATLAAIQETPHD